MQEPLLLVKEKTLQNSSVMRRAMTYARDFDVPLIHETQDKDLIGQGVMNEGLLASWLGLSGIPREAEVIPLERDLRLAALTQTRYHAAQISTALSADALRLSKQRSEKFQPVYRLIIYLSTKMILVNIKLLSTLSPIAYRRRPDSTD